MYSYLLRLALKDGSIKEIRSNSTNAKKSIMNLIDESEVERGRDLVEEVSRVLYFKRERFYLEV